MEQSPQASACGLYFWGRAKKVPTKKPARSGLLRGSNHRHWDRGCVQAGSALVIHRRRTVVARAGRLHIVATMVPVAVARAVIHGRRRHIHRGGPHIHRARVVNRCRLHIHRGGLHIHRRCKQGRRSLHPLPHPARLCPRKTTRCREPGRHLQSPGRPRPARRWRLPVRGSGLL